MLIFEEDIKIRTGKKTSKYFKFFLNIFPVRKKLVTKKNLPISFLICGNNYEEDLKFGFGRGYQNISNLNTF